MVKFEWSDGVKDKPITNDKEDSKGALYDSVKRDVVEIGEICFHTPRMIDVNGYVHGINPNNYLVDEEMGTEFDARLVCDVDIYQWTCSSINLQEYPVTVADMRNWKKLAKAKAGEVITSLKLLVEELTSEEYENVNTVDKICLVNNLKESFLKRNP